MASSLLLLIAAAAAVSLLISPASSQTCKSQKFGENTTFSSCMDLPTLNAFLHWTYINSSANATLSIAFIATPASPNGWIAWALNPIGTGMVGAQALLAFRDSTEGGSSSAVVKTYSISSRSSITESPISYEVLSKRAEFSGGTVTIFATLVLPPGTGAKLNQVWQVGASVRNGAPVAHAMSPENLSSKGTLLLESTAAKNGHAPPPEGTSGGGGGPPPTPAKRNVNDNGGCSMICVSGFWLYGILVLLGVVLGF
ncbi:hypothetical protein ABFS82_14G056800 [Erythranthe guttata]|uniref:DOMON domain-containing protein n=1 Tax=Erythranthe guttata TaxID=4155 RepID=A0A022RJM8_ERYGU|nr:PREDICTED: auxin-induced in root cultures protein 12-like [Erythranthe guttata]EYU40647.1 hypothetical protein MIMGU_mgv1a020871mg [Erythranthe guttata]|eukprot:XP_012833517.1 PREDICTED: auxin-induced in root cultures protein 12-like [Erythranthe guttata]